MFQENINEIELSILFIMLSKHEQRDYIFEHTDELFFTDLLNRKIFRTAKSLYDKGEDFDNVIIYEKNRTSEMNERLTEIIIGTVASTPLLKNYCKVLFDNHLAVRIKSATTTEEFEAIEKLKQQYVFDDIKIKHISEGIVHFRENYEKRMGKAMFTGFNNFDNCIGSFMGGDYIALGGSTGAGKTTIALNFAKQLCIQDKNVLYFSLEMPIEQLTNRFCCMIKGLSAKKYRDFGFSEEELKIYEKGLEELKEWNLNVVCDYNLTTEKMEFYIRQHKNVDFVILDYLGLMQGYNNKSLYEKSTILSRKIKCIATELDIPILVLVQLNRSNSNRQDKRPILSDIRESGAIEQDADYVIFAYREGLYDQSIPLTDLDLIIAKNRHGENSKIIKFDYELSTQNIREKFNVF